MRWLPKLLRREEGQSIVIVAMAMSASIAFLALVLDIGFLYGERRQAQNGADAGALAGGREVVRESTDSVVLSEIQRYAGANNVGRTWSVSASYVDLYGATLGAVGGGSVPASSAGVTVTVNVESSSFFAGFLGIDTLRASAAAATTVRPPAFAPIAINGWWDSAIDSYVHDNSPNYGLEFAILGSEARPNEESNDLRSFVNLDVRADELMANSLTSDHWHILNDDNTWTTPVGAFNPGSSTYREKNLDYIRRGGYTKVLPATVGRISPGVYTTNTVPAPYASLPYFSGTEAGHAVDAMKANNYQNGRYAPGSRIPVLVYDGYHQGNGNDKRVAAIGYAVVEITRYEPNTVWAKTVIPIQTDYRLTRIIEDVRLSQ